MKKEGIIIVILLSVVVIVVIRERGHSEKTHLNNHGGRQNFVPFMCPLRLREEESSSLLWLSASGMENQN